MNMDEPRLLLGRDAKGHSALCGADRLIAYGKVDEVAAKVVPVVDCEDSFIGSPFVNAHTHLYSGLAPLGMPPAQPEPRCFTEILERVWWKLDRALDHASLRAAARYYVAHALLSGTSAVIDHHESPACIDGSLDVLADACQELGMRAVLCYGATERNASTAEARKGLGEPAKGALHDAQLHGPAGHPVIETERQGRVRRRTVRVRVSARVAGAVSAEQMTSHRESACAWRRGSCADF